MMLIPLALVIIFVISYLNYRRKTYYNITTSNRKTEDFMFGNIGAKIQMVAKIIAWIEIAASIIGGIIMVAIGSGNDQLTFLIVLAPIVVAVGCLIAWLSVILIYGFGKLVEDVGVLRQSAEEKAKNNYNN